MSGADLAGQSSIVVSPTAAEISSSAGPSTQSKGRGRGRKKSSSAKSFKCDICGDIWKNELGLRYHQTKSQTACNPDYDPAAVLEEKRSRKRRRLLSPVQVPDPGAVEPAETGQEEDSKTPLTQSGRASPFPRQAVREGRRLLATSGGGFRGLVVGDFRKASTQLALELAEKHIGKVKAEAARERQSQRGHQLKRLSRPPAGAEVPRRARQSSAIQDLGFLNNGDQAGSIVPAASENEEVPPRLDSNHGPDLGDSPEG